MLSVSKIETNFILENNSSNIFGSQNVFSQNNSQMIDSFFFKDINLINDNNSYIFQDEGSLVSLSNKINDSFLYYNKDNPNKKYNSNDNSANDNDNIINDNNNKHNFNNNENKKENEIIILIERSTGKTASNTNNYINKKRQRHDRLAKDNIKRKINVYYLKFVWSLLNEIIKQLLKENIQFFKLSHSITKNVTRSAFNSLKNKTLGDIFKDNVSPKYNKYKKIIIGKILILMFLI